MTLEKLWAEKYSPNSLAEYVTHDSTHERAFNQIITQKQLPHMLLSGQPGTGKTTLAKVLVRELRIEPEDFLFVPASKKNSVDTMRDEISSFISTLPFGDFKVVLLDEADAISFSGQNALRNMILGEEGETARFILTCNYENKISTALKSRLQHFRFKAHNKDDILELVAKILIKEKIKFDLDTLEKYVSVGYPDIRKIIVLLQQNSISGELMSQTLEKETTEYKFVLLDLVAADNWTEARQVVCENVSTEEWEDLYRFLYENVHRSKKFAKVDKWEQAVITIADHLHKHSIVADPEINAAAMFIRLGQI